MIGDAGRDAHFALGSFDGKPEQMTLPYDSGPVPGIDFLRQGARSYAASRGMQYNEAGLNDVQSDPRFQSRVAAAYEGAPAGTPRVMKAYRAFADETRQQFAHLTAPQQAGGLGVRVEITDEDPYATHEEMVNDLATNRRLQVLGTHVTGSHPFLSDEENDMFRATHDAFGHAAIGRGFSRHGEEAAFHSHSQMYSPAARRAMVSETRGQNSSFIYRNYGEHFPEQKLVDMPDWSMQSRIRRGG